MPISVELADRIVEIVLDAATREYPHKGSGVWRGPEDVAHPRKAHPIFYGCFDWHSAVHSHWTLTRLARLFPKRPWRSRIMRHLDEHASDDAVQVELLRLREDAGFELPYGLAWLLTLTTELRDDLHTEPISRRLQPLRELALSRLMGWLRKLSHPIRSGQHSQSAFSMTLALRSAKRSGDNSLARQLTTLALMFHQGDVAAPLAFEPSGHDFLSPSLATAELMSEILPPRDLSRWLDSFTPTLGREPTLEPVSSVDRSDGKLAHFDGLNLSRAWMLKNIAGALPDSERRAKRLLALAERHAAVGLAALDSSEYAVTHWVPTFAVYWLTGP